MNSIIVDIKDGEKCFIPIENILYFSSFKDENNAEGTEIAFKNTTLTDDFIISINSFEEIIKKIKG